MGFTFKHDIKINLKHEKELFRFARLLLFTFLFSAVFLGVPDYIWNMTLWRIISFLVPWIVAIPAMGNLQARGVKLREIIGERVVWQFLTGCAIGLLTAVVFLVFYCVILGKTPAMAYFRDGWSVLYYVAFYIGAVGPSEELVYRITVMGSLQELLEKHRWIAPLVANLLFAASHMFQTSFGNALFAFAQGLVYTLLVYRWKRCRLVMAAAIHGIYDLAVVMLPYMYICITA